MNVNVFATTYRGSKVTPGWRNRLATLPTAVAIIANVLATTYRGSKVTPGWRNRLATLPTAVAIILSLSGCDSDPEESVEITSPVAGAVVTVPFQVTVEASVPLGSPADGLHHVHVWFGDDLESYLVVEENVVEINFAPDGEQDMFVSLRNSDHSAAGVEISVPLVINGGSPLDN